MCTYIQVPANIKRNSRTDFSPDNVIAVDGAIRCSDMSFGADLRSFITVILARAL